MLIDFPNSLTDRLSSTFGSNNKHVRLQMSVILMRMIAVMVTVIAFHPLHKIADLWSSETYSREPTLFRWLL